MAAPSSGVPSSGFPSPPDNSSSKDKSKPKSRNLEVPTPLTARPKQTTNPSQLLPATALFSGPHSRNASHTSVNRTRDRDRDRDTGTPTDNPSKPLPTPGQQHLPRAHPPTSSFSGVPRPSLIGTSRLPNASQTARGQHGGTAAISNKPSNNPAQPPTKRDEDFRADAVWAEMQRTLADVELSAMNSSHVFSDAHANALEDLRSAQLGLAGAWARSEEAEGQEVDEEFGREGVEGVGAKEGIGTMRSGKVEMGSSPSARSAGKGERSRQGSTASNGSARGPTLEEETERDIRLARRRREANDRYFRQVNSGVLDVVKKLDEVVGAMRRVEKESREIWDEKSDSDSDEGEEGEKLGDVAEADEESKRVGTAARKRAGTAVTEESGLGLGMGTDSEALTDSPVGRRR